MVDFQGRKLEVGQKVARAYRYGNSAKIEIRSVERIENGKLYLSGSRVPIQSLDNLVIMDVV